MNPPGHYQSAEDFGGPMDWGATINGSCDASLAYPHINDGFQAEVHDLQHDTMLPQLDDEGLELGYLVKRAAC